MRRLATPFPLDIFLFPLCSLRTFLPFPPVYSRAERISFLSALCAIVDNCEKVESVVVWCDDSAVVRRGLSRYRNQLSRTTACTILQTWIFPISAIELEAHVVKGTGKTHAKWSPVATARYRMLPEIVLNEVLEGVVADELVAKCLVKVFDIEDLGNGNKRATVARSRDCTLCRECVRGEEWEKQVSLWRFPLSQLGRCLLMFSSHNPSSSSHNFKGNSLDHLEALLSVLVKLTVEAPRNKQRPGHISLRTIEAHI